MKQTKGKKIGWTFFMVGLGIVTPAESQSDWYCTSNICDGSRIRVDTCQTDRDTCRNHPLCLGLVCENKIEDN